MGEAKMKGYKTLETTTSIERVHYAAHNARMDARIAADEEKRASLYAENPEPFEKIFARWKQRYEAIDKEWERAMAAI